MGYASWTSSEDSFTDKQWEEPVILTFNGQQHTALLHVDTDKQDARVIINRNYNAAIEEIGNDTEVSVALPTKYDYESVLGQLRQYYRIYKIPKIRIDISLDITPPAAVIDSEIDAESGFNSYWDTSRRRVPSVVSINVKTNVPDWLGAAGKTYINQIPYGETIAKALSTMSRNIPSYRGQGYAAVYESSSSPGEKSIEDYRADFLNERRGQIEADPSLRETDRLTQRGSWYRVRPRMVEDGFIPMENWGTTGKSFADGIRDACKELWPDEYITREYLGIYAKARGMFYFKSNKYPIEYESIDDLASKAPINVVIEKDGVPSVLEPYADKYGVALVSTQGNFVDYVKDFVRAAMEDYESVVATLLDDDKVGHDMAESTDAVNIGVGKEAVFWLQKNGYQDLKLEDVQEYDEYHSEYRIEIDSILAIVGAEGLWKYIMHKVEELAPFDLTKSVDMPANEVLFPDKVSEFLSFVNDYTDGVTKHDRDEINDELSKSKKLPDVKDKNREIKERLERIVAEDEGMKLIVSKLTKVRKELRELDEGDEEG
jgi:hypothetical protein